MKTQTIDDFDKKYSQSRIKSQNFENGRFETFGTDLEKVMKMCKKDHKRVWTAVDGDDGNIWITAGFHYINRVYYVVTKEQWKRSTEQYVVEF